MKSNKEKKTTHGLSNSSEYRAWRSAKERCSIPSHGDFKNYGGRGIGMCKRYKESFIEWLSDLGFKTSNKHSIDRIDVDGHYSCGKCEECIANNWPMTVRWADPVTQRNNQRRRARLEEYTLEELKSEIVRKGSLTCALQ